MQTGRVEILVMKVVILANQSQGLELRDIGHQLVPPLDSEDLGRRRAPLEEITQNVHASALIPAQRNGRFEIIET